MLEGWGMAWPDGHLTILFCLESNPGLQRTKRMAYQCTILQMILTYLKTWIRQSWNWSKPVLLIHKSIFFLFRQLVFFQSILFRILQTFTEKMTSLKCRVVNLFFTFLSKGYTVLYKTFLQTSRKMNIRTSFLRPFDNYDTVLFHIQCLS